MAVDQVRHLNLFKEMLSYNNNNNINNNPFQISNNLIPTAGSVLPFYPLNDGVFCSTAGTPFPPAVKDDSGVTFNNSLVNPRKRPRETPPIISAGGGGCGDLSSLLTVNPIASTNSTEKCGGLSFLGEDLSLLMLNQQLELDRLISQHMEKMRAELEDKKRQQLRRTLLLIQESISKRLKEKDEEIEKIGKINWALEEKIKSMYLENQIWRDLAQTNEATANALRTNLEQVLHQVRDNVEPRGCGTGAGVGDDLTDDAVSCCGSSGFEVDGKGKMVIEERRVCRRCGEGESSVLLLPCRHLCLCASCGPGVNTCPVCGAAKNASVNVNLS